MTTTTIIFKNHNRNLMLRLIPSKYLPIYCNSFTNVKEMAFDYTLKQNGIKE